MTWPVPPQAVYYYKDRPYANLLTARMHADESLYVCYIPLYINPEWPIDGPGSIRPSLRPIDEFVGLFKRSVPNGPLIH
jgi:hypothetical protein